MVTKLSPDKTQELRELQGYYKRRREEIKKQGEQELQRMESDYKSRLQEKRINRSERLRDIDIESNKIYDNLEKVNTKKIEDVKDRFQNKEKYITQEYKNTLNNLKEQHRNALNRVRNLLDHTEVNFDNMRESRQKQIENFQDQTRQMLDEKMKSRIQATNDLSHKFAAAEAKHETHHKMNMDELAFSSHQDILNMKSESTRELNQLRSEISKQKNAYDSALNALQNRFKIQKKEKAANGEATVKEIEIEYDQEIEKLKNSHKKKINDIKNKHKRQLSQIINKYGVERIRMENNLKSSYNNQKTRLSSELSTMKSMYTDQIDREQFTKEQQLKSIQRNNRNYVDHLQNQYTHNHKKIYKEHAKQLDTLRGEMDDRFVSENKIYGREIKNLRKRATDQMKDLYRTRLEDIARFNAKNDDPFYKIKHLDTELIENDNEFIIKAQVPDHEKSNIRVTLNRNNITVSGVRKFEKTVEAEEEGKKIKNSSYQTYSESFPITKRVDNRKMTKFWDGNTLVVKIPKT